jgi:hypothetical protein
MSQCLVACSYVMYFYIPMHGVFGKQAGMNPSMVYFDQVIGRIDGQPSTLSAAQGSKRWSVAQVKKGNNKELGSAIASHHLSPSSRDDGHRRVINL